MAALIYPAYPPAISPEEQREVEAEISEWALVHGLAVRPSPAFVPRVMDMGAQLAVAAPVTIFPSLFPRECFQKGRDVQRVYNELYANIASDEAWLESVIKEVIEVDDFIEKLWNVHLAVEKEGYAQDLELGLFRSDYMVHAEEADAGSGLKPKLALRQVEFNTMASSFGGLAALVSQLHLHLFGTILSELDFPWDCFPVSPKLLPANNSTLELADGIVAAHNAYGPSRSVPQLHRCALFVVQDGERNVFDQRHLQDAVGECINVFRMPFSKTLEQTTVGSDPGRPLIYKPPNWAGPRYEVTVLYFRSTYSPFDFLSDSSWAARLHLERSAAIKCPSILTHLAGSKKVQQVLATPSSTHLERFLPKPEDCAAVRQTFAAMYPLDDSPAGEQAKKLATSPEDSRRFVLKPQREGGGNNVYGADIPPFLAQLESEEKWRGYVLMERIEPPAQRNSVLREGEVQSGEVIAELGIFGTCLWRRKADGKRQAEDEKEGMLRNEQAGYLLRTKGRDSNEGGVAAGFGAIDSVALIDV